MAKTPLTLTVDGFTDREVKKFEFEFDQATDIEGQITGIPRGGILHIWVKPLNDGNPELMNWMLTKDLAKDGKITFLNTTGGTEMKKLEFKTAYCVSYDNIWADKEEPVEEIRISCKEINFYGQATYTNDWA